METPLGGTGLTTPLTGWLPGDNLRRVIDTPGSVSSGSAFGDDMEPERSPGFPEIVYDSVEMVFKHFRGARNYLMERLANPTSVLTFTRWVMDKLPPRPDVLYDWSPVFTHYSEDDMMTKRPLNMHPVTFAYCIGSSVKIEPNLDGEEAVAMEICKDGFLTGANTY